MIKAHSLSRDILLERPLPNPNEAEDKNARGRVLAIAGSSGVPGAGLLAGVASLRAGAGKVQLAVPQSIGAAAGVAFPECGIVALGETENGGPMPTAQLTRSIQNADAILVGPGLMDRGSARSLVSHCLDIRTDCALVLDALGLCDLQPQASALRLMATPAVLTPHHGEMAMLLNVARRAVDRAPLESALEVAATLRCVVVLKADTTYVASPDGQSWQHRGGVIGLATAGSGDVLAGILAGLRPRGASPLSASLWAVYVHAAAGRLLTERIGPVGFLAREPIEEIPRLLHNVGAHPPE